VETIRVFCHVETIKVICFLYIFKDFNVFRQDYQSLLSCRNNQGHLPLYFSKIIIVFCHAEIIKVICLFIFRRPQCLSTKTIAVFFASETVKSFGLRRPSRSYVFYISKISISFAKTITIFFKFLRLSKSCVLQRQSRLSASLHFKDFNVFRQDYHNLLYFSKTIRVFCFKTITVFFTFLRPSESFVSRLSQSSLLFQDHPSLFFQDYHNLLYFFKTIKVCCLAKTINVFYSLRFQRLSVSSVETSMSPLLFKPSRSFV